jgi:hypothetical protein
VTIYHKELAAGRWKQFSLAEQMGNIGSEVGRAIKLFRKQDEKSFQLAFERALELFDLTLEDDRWKGRRKEIARSREVFCLLLTELDSVKDLDKELDSLDEYFLQFGILANERKYRNAKG